jgi:hypothetical protein
MRQKLLVTFNHITYNATQILEITMINLRKLLPHIFDVVDYNISPAMLRTFNPA